ncbi:MAG: tRNA epoxyqueuosine(34) reductase QueG [Acidobacteriia bacterium]|nr:tRNA epoxyqueuosine(34) reductase QueG [Terriglobia bacterium]
MDAAALTQALLQRARDEGFDAAGVAEARSLTRDAGALESWLSRGFHAAMGWMARSPDRRSDPRKLMPGCKSVVCLAANYGAGEPAAPLPEGRAKVALYARRRDYHGVLRRRARRLAAWLEETTGHPARAFVDTGPLLERAWAEASGLGWIGKNANLLTRERGSWLLLCEILSAARLAPTSGPHAEFCGTCNACLDACPTGAIVEPGVVDSNRCISYWTIEHRGPIPEPVRPAIGEWIFGCDDCQTVCPWNVSFARAVEGGPLSERDDLRGLDPEEVLRMDEAAFRRRFSGTPLMRARWDGLRRNACVVLGNRRDPRALPTLREKLSDPDPMVRSHAEWAIGRIEESSRARPGSGSVDS